jgi:hypothetical protein
MRKLLSLAFAAVIAASTFATPASAQQMSASGSCGEQAGTYGMTDVNSSKVNNAGETVPALFYVVNYSGVPAPTTVGVIVRLNGELESQVGVASFTASNSGGSFEGALRANIDPSAQGFNNSVSKNTGNPGGSNNSPGTDSTRHGSKDGPLDHDLPGGNGNPGGNGSATQGGLGPGEYVFYIYTGSRQDVYNVKDGTVALNAFVADEKGFLGWFSCGVSTEQGSGPG